jgi:hypothetical protein
LTAGTFAKWIKLTANTAEEIMNRRNFFGSIAAVITAAVIPIDFGDDTPTFWTRDPMRDVWWSAGSEFKRTTKIGTREIAALEKMWQACIKGGGHPSQIYVTDEQLAELKDEIHRSGWA